MTSKQKLLYLFAQVVNMVSTLVTAGIVIFARVVASLFIVMVLGFLIIGILVQDGLELLRSLFHSQKKN